MAYEVLVPKPVQKQLDRLPESVYRRVLKRIVDLKQEPRPRGSVKLTNRTSEYRIRIGDYRLRYEIQEQDSIVVLLHCRHRREVYRR